MCNGLISLRFVRNMAVFLNNIFFSFDTNKYVVCSTINKLGSLFASWKKANVKISNTCVLKM